MTLRLVFAIGHGKLYQGDGLELMQSMEAESVDCIFADPPL